jgi:hypothetical protein
MDRNGNGKMQAGLQACICWALVGYRYPEAVVVVINKRHTLCLNLTINGT